MSKKVIPRSSARLRIGTDRSSSRTQDFQAELPRDMVPRHRREALRPVRPKGTYCMRGAWRPSVRAHRRCFLLDGRLGRGYVIERDDPAAVDLAQQPRVDAVLRMLGPHEGELADELRGIGCEQLDAQVVKAQRAATLGCAAVIANVVLESALPALLEAAAGDENDVRVLETSH